MPEKKNSEEAIFEAALTKKSEAECAAFLEGACLNNPRLRYRQRHHLHDSVLQRAVKDPQSTPLALHRRGARGGSGGSLG